VVEIGAGSGVLTRALAATGARVVALELDPRLASDLRRHEQSARVEVVTGDALEWRWPLEEFAVVANLPFHRSGAILMHLLGDPSVELRRADLIVQWELAAKQVAVWPSTLKSAFWGAWYELAVTRRIDRTAFAPTPSVDAALLRVTPRDRPLVPPKRHREYRQFLREAFDDRPAPGRLTQRLSRIEVKRLAPMLGFSMRAQPRDLDAHQWAALFDASTNRGR
jgi:23S rRNA (adenine-N6)-dimethyltransferase